MNLPISGSKPSGVSDVAFLKPMPGWSNFTPILTVPASARSAMRVPASKSGLSTTSYSSSPPVVSSSSPASPQADRARTIDAAIAAHFAFRMFMLLPSPRGAGGGRSVGEDLREEVLGAGRLWIGEELIGAVLLDDATVVHEQDAMGGGTREAHLVRDDDHRHAPLREVDHGVEDLLDHLRIKCGRRLVEEHDLG